MLDTVGGLPTVHLGNFAFPSVYCVYCVQVLRMRTTIPQYALVRKNPELRHDDLAIT